MPKLALVIKSKIRDLVKRFPKNRLPVMTFSEFVKVIQEEIVAATPDRTDAIAYYLDLIGEVEICLWIKSRNGNVFFRLFALIRRPIVLNVSSV